MRTRDDSVVVTGGSSGVGEPPFPPPGTTVVRSSPESEPAMLEVSHARP